MNNEITIFSNDSAVVNYVTKKGDHIATSTEGALFKGGLALRALKDTAKLSAFHKAESGRYRAASDILAAAFPTLHKAFEKGNGRNVWDSKFTMGLFLDRLEMYRPKEGRDLTAKQQEAMGFVSALRNVKALASDSVGFVVEA